MSSLREEREKLEHVLVGPYGVLAEDSKGRLTPEEPCPIRTCFQRDVDRITHAKSFRRLKHKTQVFLQPEGDHYRTRLTHTLEVTRLARTVARALRLNEDLAEAIALGHDLGHTPFGHAGERALRDIMGGAFHHYEQSLRVVDRIEKDGLKVVNDGTLTVGLDTKITDSLSKEGYARDLVRGIQNLRKESGFELTDRIALEVSGDDKLKGAFEQFKDYIASETLATSADWKDSLDGAVTIESDELAWQVKVAKL